MYLMKEYEPLRQIPPVGFLLTAAQPLPVGFDAFVLLPLTCSSACCVFSNPSISPIPLTDIRGKAAESNWIVLRESRRAPDDIFFVVYVAITRSRVHK